MNPSCIYRKIALVSFIYLLVNPLFAQVNFTETNLIKAKQEISKSKLPIIIYFSGVWCPSCQLMEETTFQDVLLGDRIRDNYLAYKIDVDAEHGKQWMQEYAITCLPTTLFLDKNAQLVERFESPITSSNFLKLTDNHSKTVLYSGNEVQKSNTQIPEKTKQNPALNTIDDYAVAQNKSTKNATNLEQLIAKEEKGIYEKERKNKSQNKVTSKEFAHSNEPNNQDYQVIIEAIELEINNLKTMHQANQDYAEINNNGNKSDAFNNKNSQKIKSGKNTFLAPTKENLLSQLEACKALLGQTKNLGRIIEMLEDYKVLLSKMQAESISKNFQIPSEYKPYRPAKAEKNIDSYQSQLAHNQQIIRYLNLSPPIKKGNQFIVQIGQYRNIRNVERLVQVIRKKYNYPIKVLIQKQGDNPIQTVYLGEFKTKDAAIAANNQLKGINRKGIVKQL